MAERTLRFSWRDPLLFTRPECRAVCTREIDLQAHFDGLLINAFDFGHREKIFPTSFLLDGRKMATLLEINASFASSVLIFEA
jgi:hypothetical protein